MPIPLADIKAICFDFGNTLVEFSDKQFQQEHLALKNVLEANFGHCDLTALKVLRDRQITAPFSNGFRENDMLDNCLELVRELYQVTPSQQQLKQIIDTRYHAFVSSVEISDHVIPLLEKLSQRYRLGFLSNYPCAHSMLAGLTKIQLSALFDTTVISADIGFVKPHTKPFEALLSQLKLSPAQCIYVGDNWLADVQGAKQMGMYSILTTQFAAYEAFQPQTADLLPDATISHLNQLTGILL